MYFVIRRSDDYVGVETFATELLGRQQLGKGMADGAGGTHAVQILLVTDDWDEAQRRVATEWGAWRWCASRGCLNARQADCGELCAPCWNDLHAPHPHS